MKKTARVPALAGTNGSSATGGEQRKGVSR